MSTEKLPYVIVLAGNTREGRKYARRADLPKGRHRVVHSAKQIRKLRHAEIHELPGFAKRPDRHAINAALKFTRGTRKLVEMPPSPLDAITAEDPRGELTERQLEVAHRYQRLREAQHAAWDADLKQKFDELGPDLRRTLDQLTGGATHIVKQAETDDAKVIPEVVKLVETSGRKRRTRCSICNELVWDDADPGHDESKHVEHAPATAVEGPSLVINQKITSTPENFFGQA